MIREIVLNAFNEFCKRTELVNTLFKEQFKLTISPIKASSNNGIPKRGELITSNKSVLKYGFHGKGCSVAFGDATIDFDYWGSDYYNCSVSTFYLLSFLKEYEKEYSFADDEFYSALDQLEKEGILERTVPSYGPFKLITSPLISSSAR